MCNHSGVTVWFTGLSGAGKTTIAVSLAEKLQKRGTKIERLDGDIVRQSLTRDLALAKTIAIKTLSA